jgi:hypothetical protein
VNRRNAITAVAAAIGAFTLDPERALWVPGKRSIFDLGATRLVDHVSLLVSAYDSEWWNGEGDPKPSYVLREIGIVPSSTHRLMRQYSAAIGVWRSGPSPRLDFETDPSVYRDSGQRDSRGRRIFARSHHMKFVALAADCA